MQETGHGIAAIVGGTLPQTIPLSLMNFQDRMKSLHERLLDLEQTMRRIADNTFGIQHNSINKDSPDLIRQEPTEDTFVRILGEVEQTTTRLCIQCNRF